MNFKENNFSKKTTTPEQGFLKALNYCVYQERCHQEVRNKLYEWGLWHEIVENIISKLIQENYLNEERFAIAYAGGKFRVKQWGKNKIKQSLLFKKVSIPCINSGLSTITTKDYVQTLEKIINKKQIEIKMKNNFLKNCKIANYIIGRGFEAELVWELLQQQG